MVKKLSLISVCIMFIGMSATSNATGIGGLAGFGHYWSEGVGVSGFALSGYFDVNLSGNFVIAPTINFWAGSEYGESISDLTPAIAFKYSFFPATVAVVPYIGFAPELHILFGNGESEAYFGFGSFGGLGINLTEYMQVPIQAGYGLIFGEGGTLNVFTVKIGIAANF